MFHSYQERRLVERMQGRGRLVIAPKREVRANHLKMRDQCLSLSNAVGFPSFLSLRPRCPVPNSLYVPTHLSGIVFAAVSAAELTLFENDNFNGRRFGVNSSVSNLAGAGFNDRASSVVVRSGTWQVCDDASWDTYASPGQARQDRVL